MRGLTMALLATNVPGHGRNRRAGWLGAPFLSNSTKAKTTTKKTTGKMV